MDNFSIGYHDKSSNDTINAHGELFHLSLLNIKEKENISLGELLLQSSEVYIHQNTHSSSPENNPASTNDLGYGEITIDKLTIRENHFQLTKPKLKVEVLTKDYSFQHLRYQAEQLLIQDMFYQGPIIKIRQVITENRPPRLREKTSRKASGMLENITSRFSIGEFNMANAEIDYSFIINDRLMTLQQSNSTRLFFSGMTWNNNEKRFNVDELDLLTDNIQFPLDNGFYALQVKELALNKKKETFRIEGIHLKSSYEKEIFAWYHPTHKDWFDVQVESVEASGANFDRYFSSGMIDIGELEINRPQLFNYKNQHIEIEHHIMPMIYEGLQKFPVPLQVEKLNVNDMLVEYEELPKNKSVPGKALLTDLNGTFSGFTNIVSSPEQYIRLDANGKLMDNGLFTATWLLPVDSLNDHFRLTAHIRDFDLRSLNDLLVPMASGKVERGFSDHLFFNTDASSKGATVQMLFLYHDLNASLLKEKNGEMKKRRFLSFLVNLIIRDNNPRTENKKPHQPDLTITRDPYHSTFNYLWQILEPPLVESVGVSQKTQNFMKSTSAFFKKVKNFFTGKK
ncbi:MAG: DUF748 domain-containing protein [Candidatus Azobacteroides sp.]|nr:DUF748 domain-containing protein [Candidatus Azobacteroides sp.]